MFGENQEIPIDSVGQQSESEAKRALQVTRNMQAIEGVLQEPRRSLRPGDKRPASPSRETPPEDRRDRERRGLDLRRDKDRERMGEPHGLTIGESQDRDLIDPEGERMTGREHREQVQMTRHIDPGRIGRRLRVPE